MVDHCPSICGQTAHCTPDMCVDLHDLLDARRFEEGGLDTLLDAENDAICRLDADGR
jgi:hypothetical protein